MTKKNTNNNEPTSSQGEEEMQLKKHLEDRSTSPALAEPERQNIELQMANDGIQAEKKLFGSEKRFRLLVELAPSGIAVYQNGVFTYVNPAGLKLMGAKDPLQLIGKQVLSIVHPDSKNEVIKRMELVATGIAVPAMEEKLIRLDGTTFDAEVIALATTYNDQPAGQVVVRDITQHKKAEAELREKEIQYRNLADCGLTLIWTSGPDKLCNYFNKPWLQFTGRTLEQELGNGWTEGVHPDDLAYCLKTYQTAFDNRSKFDMEYRVRHISGEYRWIRDLGTPNYNSSGEFIGYIGHCLDISEQKHAEKALHESQILYHSLVENMPAGVFRKDSEGRFIFVNSVFCQLKGLTEGEILGKTANQLSELKAAGSPEMVQLQHASAIKGEGHHAFIMHTGKHIDVEETYIKPDGTIQYLQVIKSPAFSSDGTLIGSQGILFDITDRKLAEEKLTKSEFALKEAQRVAHIGSWDYDVLADRPIWSEELFKIFERNPEEGEPSWIEHKASIYPEDWEKADNAVQKAIKDGSPYEVEFRIIKPDKSLKWAFTIGKAVKDANGKVYRLYGTVQDINEHKRAEVELMDAKEKAEESNRLKSAFLSNMSHEIRTPMNAIMGFSNLMAEVEGEEKNEYAAIIQKSSNQLLALIDDVIHLSRLQSEKMAVNNTSFKPAILVTDVYRMFNLPSINERIEIIIHIPGQYNEFIMQSDADKITQVLTNLVSNAVKYTPAGSVEIGFDLLPGNIEFYVKDTGIGIPEQEQQYIFETFYRSERAISSAIRGTGLGLSISKELVSLLGGKLGVSSVPNKGSRFYFTVPFVSSELVIPVKSVSQSVKYKLKDFILLVADDEPVNFLYLKTLLKDKVKRIDHALNGKEAIELASKNNYDLVLMDIKMPVMGGIEATKILKKQLPELPIIAQTAYSLPEDKALALQAGCDEFISKPIIKEKLMEIINKYF
jgi:PAS domain S-box-containing protein